MFLLLSFRIAPLMSNSVVSQKLAFGVVAQSLECQQILASFQPLKIDFKDLHNVRGFMTIDQLNVIVFT